MKLATRRAAIQCESCKDYFPVTARRVKQIQRGEASQVCPECRLLANRADVVVLTKHKDYWRDLARRGHVTISGEVVDWDWIEDVGQAIYG